MSRSPYKRYFRRTDRIRSSTSFITSLSISCRRRPSPIDRQAAKKIEFGEVNAEERGAFPDSLSGPLQYGHCIVAFAAHLLVAQMVPLKRVVQTMKAMTGRAVAEATLLAWLLRLHDALADWEAAAVECLLAAPALHVDETSIRIDRKNHWLHDYSAGDLTLKFCHRKRGGEAIRDKGVGLFPYLQIRRRMVQDIKLPAVHVLSGIQSPCRHRDRSPGKGR